MNTPSLQYFTLLTSSWYYYNKVYIAYSTDAPK